MKYSEEQISAWQTELMDKDPPETLSWAASKFRGKIRFSSSLGLEDQVITDMIANADLDIGIFTLDTGRLFQETYELIQAIEDRYNLKIHVYFPDSGEVEAMVREHGINLFYKSVALRKMCCGIRKINPLHRALSGLDSWVTGLRREQSKNRQGLHKVEWDGANEIVKVNPLCDWTQKELWSYIKKHDVPYNILHDKGFPSIGCFCCTRAVEPGEDIRAGRWWWESDEHKECGLHIKNGNIIRPEES